MKNKIKLPAGVNPKPFNLHLDEQLSNTLGEQLRHSISNLLAIDYSLRLNSSPPLEEYVNLCGSRLKAHIDHKIIFDETFSAAMTLFTVAITPQQQTDEEDQKSVQQSQDAVIESVIAAHFGDLSYEEQQTIRMVLKNLLNGKDGKELMNIVTSDPKLFHSIVASAVKAKKQQEISEVVGTHLTTILVKSKALNKKVTGFKAAFAKMFLATGIVLAASIGIVIGGLALPALILPTVLCAVKYGSALGEKIGNNIAQNVPSIALETKSLNELIRQESKGTSVDKPELSNNIKNQLSQEQTKELAQGIELESVNIKENKEQTALERASQQRSTSNDKGRTF
jgi:hypothetical protein